MPPECSHLDQLKIVKTTTHVCPECEKLGDTWVHLRMCTECGHVGCCDSSKNRHATRHFQQTHHALMRSIEPGERWLWCYVDQFSPGEVRESAA